jgi:hypothetical protein
MNRPAAKMLVSIRVPAGVDLFKEALGPIYVVIIRPGGYEAQVLAEGGHPIREASELRGIIFRSEIATAAPTLVADAPVLDIERLRRARGGANVREGCGADG